MKRLIIFCIFLSFTMKTFELERKISVKECYESMEFSQQNLYSYICLLGFKDPNFVFKQAILETGWFKSNLFKRTKNLFGLHYPSRRKTTADYWCYADGGKYNIYKHWTKSVKDLKLYENWVLKTHPNKPYHRAILLAGYCTDVFYVYNINNIKYNFKTFQKG
jgi:uncharacterized FlgJ-related protein